MTLTLQALMPVTGLIPSTLGIGVLVFTLGLIALWHLRETWGSDLDYRER